MFALFYSLYYSMFVGAWSNKTISQIVSLMTPTFNSLGKLLTSIFGEFQYTDFGNDFANYWVEFVAFVLALITSIGIVVVATKGIKKIFTVFFYGVR